MSSIQYVQYTEFRNHAKDFFESIQKGIKYIIIKRGQPIAEISSINTKTQTWKRSIVPVKLHKNITTTDVLMNERKA